jgi:hypothetical protein
MNHESQLKLQAWLDGELSPADVRDVLRRVERDAESAALARELKLTRQWLAAGEPKRPVPETREFYWSQIARRLAPRDVAAELALRPSRILARWWRWLAAATAVCVLAAVWLVPRLTPPSSAAAHPAEVETPTDELGSFTFHSDSEQMTVVWVNSY